jgi:hypothetical protein
MPPVSFVEMSPNDGLDVVGVPPWLMVPKGGAKVIRVQNAGGATFLPLTTALVKVSELPPSPAHREDRLISIAGVMPGSTLVEVRRAPSLVLARLECCVKAKKTVKVAFNFVEDSAGHRTTRSSLKADSWVKAMNAIFLPQANVEIKKHATRSVKVAKDLGRVVRFSAHLPTVPAAQHEWGVVTALADATADFNVFFVWEYEQDITPNKDHTDAGTMGANCIFEDKAGKDVGETLAHETGHFLGAPDTYAAANKNLLMYGITDVRGQRITKGDANLFNP